MERRMIVRDLRKINYRPEPGAKRALVTNVREAAVKDSSADWPSMPSS